MNCVFGKVFLKHYSTFDEILENRDEMKRTCYDYCDKPAPTILNWFYATALGKSTGKSLTRFFFV